MLYLCRKRRKRQQGSEMVMVPSPWTNADSANSDILNMPDQRSKGGFPVYARDKLSSLPTLRIPSSQGRDTAQRTFEIYQWRNVETRIESGIAPSSATLVHTPNVPQMSSQHVDEHVSSETGELREQIVQIREELARVQHFQQQYGARLDQYSITLPEYPDDHAQTDSTQGG